ncbi:hypothetical protein BDV23DRAFT_180236 [Aspergillus alliaceus]|uniref:Uncharacterized protein n=1 Tax=Petromyces alliaceus TaxID=209559 RepID=A0A5N7CIA2_PETAA|nr:hypothetical protein BDV23DRAFT_180236 [Aspergillus alliaceus]
MKYTTFDRVIEIQCSTNAPEAENPSIIIAHCSPCLEMLDLDVKFAEADFNLDTIRPQRPVPEEHRLVQSAVSTHILAGLLGLMLVCAVASSTLLLPNDLCRIAAKASLLAEPKLLSEYVILTGSE